MKNTFYTLAISILFFLTGCGEPTNACFTYSPVTIAKDSAVTFDGSCSQNTMFFKWNFGDGTADTSVTSTTITHKFTSSGQFAVTLNAKRKDGATLGKDHLTTSQIITIQ